VTQARGRGEGGGGFGRRGKRLLFLAWRRSRARPGGDEAGGGGEDVREGEGEQEAGVCIADRLVKVAGIEVSGGGRAGAGAKALRASSTGGWDFARSLSSFGGEPRREWRRREQQVRDHIEAAEEERVISRHVGSPFRAP
jgi:hypothetical protein